MMIQLFKKILKKTLIYPFLLKLKLKKKKKSIISNWVEKDKPIPPPHLIKQETVKEYARKFSTQILIESGTYLGDMVFAMKYIFSQIYSIEIDSVCKKYCKSLKRSMLYGVKDIARNTIGLSSHSDKLRKNEFWALDDISFEVKKGETLGIIGPNGSGKTTMLKMLNGIFWPDKGKISIKGKVGALIEVGAGFHPLLTGRENIYINAAILGMTKEETDEKFDAIIEFADIGDFLDVPVKHYSSGMFVRLGFAVAVHCEPDILLVDEVLAVGDLRFSLKCHRKMSEFRQNGGTVAIVSHNLQAIRNMCKKVLWLNNGKIKEIGEVHNICNLYEENIIKNSKNSNFIKGKQYQYDSEVSISGKTLELSPLMI